MGKREGAVIIRSRACPKHGIDPSGDLPTPVSSAEMLGHGLLAQTEKARAKREHTLHEMTSGLLVGSTVKIAHFDPALTANVADPSTDSKAADGDARSI